MILGDINLRVIILKLLSRARNNRHKIAKNRLFKILNSNFKGNY